MGMPKQGNAKNIAGISQAYIKALVHTLLLYSYYIFLGLPVWVSHSVPFM